MSDRDIKWYYTEEGEKSFRYATSLSERVLWIYKFLSCLNQDNDPKLLLKLSYVIADQMWDSAHEFSGWPNIIDEERNPFLSLVIKGEIQDIGDYCAQEHGESIRYLCAEYMADKLLCALHKKKVGWFSCQELEKYDTSDETIYLIEREIIWLFCGNNTFSFNTGTYGHIRTENRDYRENGDHNQKATLTNKLLRDFKRASSEVKKAKIRQREVLEVLESSKREEEAKKYNRLLILAVLIAAIILILAFIRIQFSKRGYTTKGFSDIITVYDDYGVIGDDTIVHKEAATDYAGVIIDELYYS